jgi:hypothetical protein
MEPLGNNNTADLQSQVDPNKSNNENTQILQSLSGSSSQQGSTNITTLCVVCSTRSRALVLVPCGHFNVCIPCGHSLVECPICGTNVKALVRIYG